MVVKSKIYDVQVKCDDCGEIADPEPPENRRYYTGGMALVLGFIGFLIGSVFGIATAGVGFVAYIVTLPAGLVVGWWFGDVVAELVDGVSCPHCGTEF